MRTGNVSPPAMAPKRVARPSACSSALRQAFELVGAHRQARAGREQLVQQLGDALERPAADRNIVGVEGEEMLVQAPELLPAGADPAKPQPCLDHGEGAVADEGVQLGNRDGAQPFERERVVGCGGQIGRRVDQRAVEVENDGGIAQLEGHDLQDRDGRRGNLFGPGRPVTPSRLDWRPARA